MDIKKFIIPMLVVLSATLLIVTPVCASDNNVVDAEIALDIPDLLSVQTTIITPNLLDKMILQISNNDQLDVSDKEQRLNYISSISEKYPNLTVDDTERIMDLMSDIINESEQIDITLDYPIAPYWAGVKPDEGPPYSHGMHNAMARRAASTMGISDYYANVIEAEASAPDTWSWQSDTALHYSPSAEYYAETYANEAKDYLSNQQYVNGYERLAHSLHYMTDLSNPFHASSVLMIRYLTVHSMYEYYVADNWESGENYRNVMTSTSGYYAVSDVGDSGSNLASLTGSYANAIYLTMLAYPATWEDDPDVIDYTKECIELGIRYDKGLVKYVIG